VSTSVGTDVGTGVGAATKRAFVALAHTHDDQLETLLLKLLRGVHVANFHGVRVQYLYIAVFRVRGL
jgi:tRNA(Ile)-lysidine synthase TilS/MesJ